MIQTLRYIFAVVGGFKVVADKFQLRLDGDSVTYEAIDEIIVRMREDGFWTDRSVWSRVMAVLPEYRLSTFQRALPAEYSEEMVGSGTAAARDSPRHRARSVALGSTASVRPSRRRSPATAQGSARDAALRKRARGRARASR